MIEYPGGLKEWFSNGDGFFDDADTEEEDVSPEEVSPEDRLDENEETIVYDGVEYIHRINEEEDEPGEILLKYNMEVIGYYDGEDIEWISPKEWSNHKKKINLVSPANKRNINIIVVGTGLAGASASATLAELGYNVKSFCFQDSPRRAHSIAAQGGINAAKNYQGDGDSIYRLFYDTIKGGDYRSREANVYRLAEVSANIIDQCVAQGVPFARDYGGLLDNRSFGGVLVSRTFYAKGQTGQQLLLGAYSALNRQIARGKIEMFNRHEMLEIV